MTVLRSAGPRTRLQLVRYPVAECGDPARRFQVRVIEESGPVVIHASREYASAAEAFEIEAHWRGWQEREVAA